MLHQSRSHIAFYAMTTVLGKLFKFHWSRQSLIIAMIISACDPSPPTAITDRDATVIPPLNRPDWGGLSLDMMLESDLPGPLFNSILPNRSPLEGGIALRIIGDGFRSPMYVRVGEQRCVSLTVESEARLSCILPGVDSPQSVDVSVAWGPIPPQGEIPDESPNAYEGALRIIPEGLSYFQPLFVEGLSPTTGPASGNSEVRLLGAGFSEVTDVRFGGSPALSVNLESPDSLLVVTPPHPAGVVDVVIRDPSGVLELESAYTYQTPLGLDQLSPRWGDLSGGQTLELYGFGFTVDTRVRIGGREAEVIEARPPARLTVLSPSSESPGWAELSLENTNGLFEEAKAFLYLDNVFGAFEVFGSIPNRLPSDLGGSLIIGGNGFTEETTVSIDGQMVTCQLDSPQRLRCFSPRRPVGISEVIVRQGLLSESFDLIFYRALELFYLSPDRAATCGGALIHVRGRGFTPETSFTFGDVQVTPYRFVSEEELWLSAPPHPPATLDLTITEGEQRLFIPEAFVYFDPLSQYGGSWGERIDHSINVTALNIYDFSPVPDVLVEARPFNTPAAAALITGRTNEDGQVTLSTETLSAPLHINVVKNGFEAQTIERVVSENLTVLLFPFTPPEGEGDPPPTPDPVTIRGTLIGLNELEKPPEPGMVIRAFIDVSHRSMLGRSINPPPAPLGILSEDGPFEIINRPGQMALIGTAAYVPQVELERYERGEISYWFLRKASFPIQMGMIRYLSLSPGASIEDLTLELDSPLDQRADVRLLNPSTGAGIPFIDTFGNPQSTDNDFEVRAFLDLDADGYWELDIKGSSTEPSVLIGGLPNLNESLGQAELLWFATSRIISSSTNSYAEHLQSDLSDQVRIGPFVGAARVQDRMEGSVISVGETLRWDYWPGVDGLPTEPPQATTVRFYQAGLPVWGFTLPGGVTELTIPPLPEEEPEAGASSGSVYISIEPMISELGIDYQDYTLLDLNNASSYSTTRFELIYDP